MEQRDRPRLGDRRRPRGAGPPAGLAHRRSRAHRRRAEGVAARQVGRQGVHRAQHRDVQGVAEPVHARRAGRDAHRGQARGSGALDRRQVLRGDADDGRGAPHRGVRQVPRHEARRGVPDEPVPRAADRRVAPGQPLGHRVPRHADRDRELGPRRVRRHAAPDPGAVAPQVAALRDVGRSSARGVRRAEPAGALPEPHRGGAQGPTGVPRGEHAAVARPFDHARGVGAHGCRRRRGAPVPLRGGGEAEPRQLRGLPERVLRQARAERAQARIARRQRRIPAQRVGRGGADGVRVRRRHRHRLHELRRGRRRPARSRRRDHAWCGCARRHRRRRRRRRESST